MVDALNIQEQGQSEIKHGLRQISNTEHKLGEMISRHIKRHGSGNFSNSAYVVTGHSNYTN